MNKIYHSIGIIFYCFAAPLLVMAVPFIAIAEYFFMKELDIKYYKDKFK